MSIKIGIMGIGVVGTAILEGLKQMGITDIVAFDKYKLEYIQSIDLILSCHMIFLSLPTPFDVSMGCFDKHEVEETLQKLNEMLYNGIVIIKSTLEPFTTDKYVEKYGRDMLILHNPEFLTARTATHDFVNQKHVIIGVSQKYILSNKIVENINFVKSFHEKYFPEAEITVCSSSESESMKLFCNSFYAVKVQFFTELYLLCKSNGTNYDVIRNMMIKNGWINDMHTHIPGPDGEISYGGMCFPKDTNALMGVMNLNNTPHSVLDGCIKERNIMRK